MASREHLQPHLDILQSILTDHPEADSGHDPTVRDSSPYDDKQIYENEHLLFRLGNLRLRHLHTRRSLLSTI